MTTLQSIREAIIKEKQRREVVSEASILSFINQGEVTEAVASLLFFAPPDRLPFYLEALEPALWAEFNKEDLVRQVNVLSFVADLGLGLRSAMTDWNLRDSARHSDKILTKPQIHALADKLEQLAGELACQSPEAAEKLRQAWLKETTARLTAEEASNPQALAKELMGDSLSDTLRNMAAVISTSNLRRLAEMRAAGQTVTEWGNDYAAFLQYAMWLGASFVACNPVEINWAWDADVERWNGVADDLIVKNPRADADTLARLMTAEVVLSNMRWLRPLFLLSEGKTGSVCFQVNPKKHDDAQTMIADVTANYEYLHARLDGGIPNVVFKLPATQAGLDACRALTKQGIGVTITVNFALFQHLPFAEAINDSEAIISCLANMSGRFAYPVRDDLLSKLDQLAAYGIDETKARQAAAWAGVATTRKLHQLLKRNGYDVSRIRPLIASARVYEGPHHEELPHPYMDLTEIVGISIITVFPKIRRPFDALPDPGFEGDGVDQPIPEDVLAILAHSEMFKQGYYVADPKWMPDEEERFRPERILTLADEATVAAWSPARTTLAEFGKAYDKFVERLQERQALGSV
ncbi:MAG: hypothetical protein HC875_00455 [Anaerolineales bacterium]|nr:hypothetical protein [Anaerolineales bacterium]